jgi:hypothetical protein
VPVSNLYPTNHLDQIRLNNGYSGLKSYFGSLIKDNIPKAIYLLNHESLHFPSLYLLHSEIRDHNLKHLLNPRNRIALEISDEIKTKQKNISGIEHLYSDYIQLVHSVLRWMLETGSADDGQEDDFDELLDICSIILTREYRDKSVLPIIVTMIFDRHNRGFFTNDLVWAFFESRDPNSLILIAEYLKSPNPKEVQFANKLLNFVPILKYRSSENVEMKYSNFLKWFEDNSLFLYFTGESMQETSNPKPYVSVLEAKYLYKIVCADTGRILMALTDDEYKFIESFQKLDDNTKELLSHYSLMLHRKNIDNWRAWIHLPLSEQIKIAGTGGI